MLAIESTPAASAHRVSRSVTVDEARPEVGLPHVTRRLFGRPSPECRPRPGISAGLGLQVHHLRRTSREAMCGVQLDLRGRLRVARNPRSARDPGIPHGGRWGEPALDLRSEEPWLLPAIGEPVGQSSVAWDG